MAHTFLDLADTTAAEVSRLRNIANALKAWTDLTRLAGNARLTESDRAATVDALAVLKRRIDATKRI